MIIVAKICLILLLATSIAFDVFSSAFIDPMAAEAYCMPLRELDLGNKYKDVEQSILETSYNINNKAKWVRIMINVICLVCTVVIARKSAYS